jgi:hypothetical protein
MIWLTQQLGTSRYYELNGIEKPQGYEEQQ